MEQSSEDSSLAQAEEIFNTTVAASVLKQLDPASIKAEVAALKEFCSKLKFQYLEQDSRDKFLRLLFLKDIDSINHVAAADVDRLLKSNALAKSELKLLKTELANLLDLNEATADEVIALNEKHMARKNELELARGELYSLLRELDGLINDSANESYTMLLDLNKMIDSQNVGPEEAIRIAETVLYEDEKTANKLAETEKNMLVKDSQNIALVAELEANLGLLKNQIQHASRLSMGHPDPEQKRAHDLRELNYLLQKFTPEHVDIRHKEEEFILSYGKNHIVFNQNLKIILSSNQLNVRDVNQVNRLSGDVKLNRLLRLLAQVLSN